VWTGKLNIKQNLLLFLILILVGCIPETNVLEKPNSVTSSPVPAITVWAPTVTPLPLPTTSIIDTPESITLSETAVPPTTSPATATLETATPATISGDYVLFARNDDLWRTDFQGTAVAPLTENKTLNWQLNEGDEWRLVALARPPRVSPDGRWVAVPTREKVILIDVARQTQIELPGPSADLVAWSPDSNHLAYVTNHAAVYVYDLTNQAASPHRLVELSNINHLVWSPDNQQVAISCCFEGEEGEPHDGQIKRIDTASGEMETAGELWLSLAGGSPPICWLNDKEVKQVEGDIASSPYCSTMVRSISAVSPDGRLRAYLQPASPDDSSWTGPSLLVVEDMQTATPLWQYELLENITIVRWSPNNTSLFLDNQQSHSPLWHIALNASDPPTVIVEDGYLIDVIAIEK